MAGSFIARFLKRLFSEIMEFLKSQGVLTVLVGGLIAALYQYRSGKLTAEALRENVAAVVYPFVWLISIAGCWLVIKTALDLHRESVAEAKAYRPIVMGYRPNSPSPLRPFGAASTALVAFVALALFTYRAAFPRGKSIHQIKTRGPEITTLEGEGLKAERKSAPLPSGATSRSADRHVASHQSTPDARQVPTPAEQATLSKDNVAPYDLGTARRQQLLTFLSEQIAPKDTLRFCCLGWSEASCVAAGKYLFAFSEAGWAIDGGKVFQMQPDVPREGISFVTRTNPEVSRLPTLPPHLGRWSAMSTTATTILEVDPNVWTVFGLSLAIKTAGCSQPE
jgi:hypothetical protein